MSLDWEEIDRTLSRPSTKNSPSATTERAQVPGGWLVRTLHLDWKSELFGVGGITFVPDIHHKWKVSEDE